MLKTKEKKEVAEKTYIIFSCGDWMKIKKGNSASEACTRLIETLSPEEVLKNPIGLEMFAVDISDLKKKLKNDRIHTVPSSYCFADAGKHHIARFYHNQYQKKLNEQH
jgi:hypothetical protein